MATLDPDNLGAQASEYVPHRSYSYASRHIQERDANAVGFKAHRDYLDVSHQYNTVDGTDRSAEKVPPRVSSPLPMQHGRSFSSIISDDSRSPAFRMGTVVPTYPNASPGCENSLVEPHCFEESLFPIQRPRLSFASPEYHEPWVHVGRKDDSIPGRPLMDDCSNHITNTSKSSPMSRTPLTPLVTESTQDRLGQTATIASSAAWPIESEKVTEPLPAPVSASTKTEFEWQIQVYEDSRTKLATIHGRLEQEKEQYQIKLDDTAAVAQKIIQSATRLDEDSEIFVKVPAPFFTDFLTTSEALQSHTQTIGALLREVQTEEKHHKERENLVLDYIREFFQQRTPATEAVTPAYPPPPSEHYASDEELDPLLYEYYEYAGDLTIFRERLQDFEFEHNQELRIRDRLRADGFPVNPPERDFLEHYFKERERMVKQISVTRERAQHLREQCIHANLDPEPLYDVDELAQVMDRSLRADGNLEQNLALFKNMSAPSKAGGPFDRINDWIFDVHRALTAHTSRSHPDITPLKRTDSDWTIVYWDQEAGGFSTEDYTEATPPLAMPPFDGLNSSNHSLTANNAKGLNINTLHRHRSYPGSRQSSYGFFAFKKGPLSARSIA